MPYDSVQDKIDEAAIKYKWTEEEKKLIEELCDEQGDLAVANAMVDS